MKAQNMNRSSIKTRKLIRKTFAEMLSEKKEISKISVSELAERADINRGTFYSHYDDIYAVAEDYENDLIERFFDNKTLVSANDLPKFLESFFEYIKANEREYMLLCRSDDILFVAKRLLMLATSKCLELCLNDKRLIDKKHLSTEINVFVSGLTAEWIKYCRGQSSVSAEELHDYAVEWSKLFIARRFSSY